MSHNPIDIFDKYLLHLQAKNQIKRDKDSQGKYSASGAGMCLRKHWFASNKFPKDEPKKTSLRNMNLGTIFGAEIEKAVHWFKKQNIDVDTYTEKHIVHPIHPISGHFDILFVNKSDRKGYLYDVKTAHSYKYRMLFGKKPDTNPSTNYQFQLGTYAWLLNDTKQFCDEIIYMANAYFNKDNGNMQILEAPLDFIDIAQEYWQRLFAYDGEKPALNDMSPAYDWECKGWCDYISHCDSPKIVQKKTTIKTIVKEETINV
tara:strand:- start:12293 stop:13069 length:777 start_codon:yes stop_codon:yes gene_type:complete